MFAGMLYGRLRLASGLLLKMLIYFDTMLTLERLGGRGGGQFDSPCGFSKIVFSRECVKRCFFGNFISISSYSCSENFIEMSKVVHKI